MTVRKLRSTPQAVERDEEQITAWREETWPEIKNGGGPGRLAGLRGRVRSGAEAAEGSDLGPPGSHPGGAGDRGDQSAAVGGRAAGDQAGAPAAAALPA